MGGWRCGYLRRSREGSDYTTINLYFVSHVFQSTLPRRERLERKLHNKQTDIEAQKNSAPLIRYVLDVYPTLEDPKEQNLLLKQVIRRIDYHKTVRVYGKAKSDLHLTIHPKIAIPQTSNI